MDITIKNFRQVRNAGNLRAYCDVFLSNGITLWQCRIVKVSTQRPWVSLPTLELADADGKRHYRAAISLPKEWYHAITKAVLTAWGAENNE